MNVDSKQISENNDVNNVPKEKKRRNKPVLHTLVEYLNTKNNLQVLNESKQSKHQKSKLIQPKKKKKVVEKKQNFSLQNTDSLTVHTVVIKHLIDAEEVEEDDEYDEILDDLKTDFQNYESINNIEIERSSGIVTLEFNSQNDALAVVNERHLKVYGGRTVHAVYQKSSINEDIKSNDIETSQINPAKHKRSRRRNKIRNNDLETKELPRPPLTCNPLVCGDTPNGELSELVVSFLKCLAKYQERAHQRNPQFDYRSRRFVLGCHETKRGLMCGKLLLLIVGIDIEDHIRSLVDELIQISSEKAVPVIAPMSRRRLGRAVRKTVRVTCVGIYSAESAYADYKKLLSIIQHTSNTAIQTCTKSIEPSTKLGN